MDKTCCVFNISSCNGKSKKRVPAAFGVLKHKLNSLIIQIFVLAAVDQLEFLKRTTDINFFLFRSFMSSFRKGSTGDGPREGELEDLHEDEPS